MHSTPREWRRFLLAASAAIFAVACGGKTEAHADFEPGDENDPIVRAVKQQALSTDSTVTLTLKNSSGYAFTQGLILFSQPFTAGTAPSTAMKNFVLQSSSTAGNATAFASALGLTVNTNAFVVPALASGGQTVVNITVPSTVQLTFIARVAVSLDDFVVATIPLTNGAPGTVTVALKGYDLQSTSTGIVTAGNGTTGANPSSTTVSVLDTSDCPSGVWTTKRNLIADDFASGAGSSTWPTGLGWDGEFGGDWYTDGVTLRVYNPNWGGASPTAPIPTVTGFWKRLDVCPASGSLLQFTSKVTSSYTDSTSDMTLVLYFFDRGGNLLSTSANHPMYGKNDRSIAQYDVAVPAATRQIAVAPMARLGAAEQGDVFVDRVNVDYEASNSYTTTSIATDDFSSSTNSGGNKNQPQGWAEFGGDWYRMTSTNWATLGNPSWYGQAAGVDTGLVKSFTLTGLQAGDQLNARVFAAATFTDATSFVRLRAIFNNSATPAESDRQVRGYGWVNLRRVTVPAGSTSVTIVINAYLGSAETSSLYVDNFSIARTRPN